MSERRPQTKYIPLRLRFRPASEYSQLGREQVEQFMATSENLQFKQPYLPSLTQLSQAERPAQQIKELLRLGNLLRADLSPDHVLAQIVDSIVACTGFRMLVIRLIDEGGSSLSAVAFAGFLAEQQEILRRKPYPLQELRKAMRPEFRISQSYFIPHEYTANIFASRGFLVSKTLEDYEPGGWHPEDAFFVPLYSPREQKLLGILFLDDPEDSQVPTIESVEIVELFANQAALAIDNAYLFQEREAERLALEQGIAALREDLEHLQSGDLRVRVRSMHEKLEPVADAINTTLEKISAILLGMQAVSQAVDEHSHNVQRNSQILVRETTQQEQQVHQISHVITEIAKMMQSIFERTTSLSEMAADTKAVVNDAQQKVDRAVTGMGDVREATMQSARTMKTLSESGQEINETITALTDLTMRMHLLALNAAIEATRAGEHGRGFAVVAQEIRTLAVHSAEAARKVGAYIRIIQHETNNASQSVEQNTQQVVLQTELVNQTGVSLEAIDEETERLMRLIQEVCTVVESQSQSSPLIKGATNEILRMMSAVGQNMREMQQSASHLVGLTNSLRSSMSEIRLQDRPVKSY
ncbi:methyl-accepting chemotaxis protein [Tengunoibacter tsumagoiensis]|uniref:Methyl-accepting transducer domain-containing protein n=1 Tax=Tengunoibacter tsumagoiensis TaxID=2014871 RepID=A0A402A554_9CHLR|nr:methyl-accepting chemotaxis protein [Tengunoibacter tsumagoiensis]GCE14283.1 hypothetical protein KTT_41420 [Tengunoibacter tsumagoiensis]